MSKVVRRASARERKVAALISAMTVGLFFGLWLLQRLGFDFSLLFPPCGLKMRTGWPCVTCGMTTAVLAFAGMHIPYSFPGAGVITAIAAGLICGVLAALIPARRASDLEIVSALAYE